MVLYMYNNILDNLPPLLKSYMFLQNNIPRSAITGLARGLSWPVPQISRTNNFKFSSFRFWKEMAMSRVHISFSNLRFQMCLWHGELAYFYFTNKTLQGLSFIFTRLAGNHDPDRTGHAATRLETERSRGCPQNRRNRAPSETSAWARREPLPRAPATGSPGRLRHHPAVAVRAAVRHYPPCRLHSSSRGKCVRQCIRRGVTGIATISGL